MSFEIVSDGPQRGICGCREMTWEEEGERELVAFVGMIGHRLGEEVPSLEIVDALCAFGTVFYNRLFGGYGCVQGHDEVCELDFC